MLSNITPRSLRHSQQNDPEGQQYPYSSDPIAELEGLRKFSLNSLMALLPTLVVTGPKALQSVALALLIYTISLRLAISTSFLHDHPTLSAILHGIPPLCTLCITSIALVSNLQSRALAAVVLLGGIFPLVILAVHRGMLCVETPTAALPVQMQDVSTPAASGSVDTPPAMR